MNNISFKQEFSKVIMKRRAHQSYIKSIFIAQTQQENLLENHQKNNILKNIQLSQSRNFQQNNKKSLSQKHTILNVEDIIETQDTIEVCLNDIITLKQDFKVIDPFKIPQLDNQNVKDPDNLNSLIENFKIIHRQQIIQFNKINFNIQIQTSSQHQNYFHKFLKKLEHRNIIGISIPFLNLIQTKENQILPKNLKLKKIVLSKKLLSFLGHSINQTCVNLKKYGLIALQILTQDLVTKICYHYKKTLNEYNKLFINNQINRQNLKKFCSCVLEQEIKFKKAESKSLYEIFKVTCEIFVPGPGIIIIQIIQKQQSDQQKRTQRFQFQRLQQIYSQQFNETKSLNHIIKLPHSKIFPKDVRICTYKQIDIYK